MRKSIGKAQSTIQKHNTKGKARAHSDGGTDKREFTKFVRISLETKADYHEDIQLYAAIDKDERIVGQFPMLGIWAPDNWRERSPFELKADRANFGAVFDDPPDCVQCADCDLIYKRVIYGQKVLWKEERGTPVEYRITAVETLDLNQAPLNGMDDLKIELTNVMGPE